MHVITPLTRQTAAAFRSLTLPTYQTLLFGLDDTTCALGVTHEGEPIGLGLATIAPKRREAELVWLYVAKEHRRKGIGTMLLRKVEKDLGVRGVHKVVGSLSPRRTNLDAVGGLLAKQGWSQPTPHMLVMYSTTDKVADAPWLSEVTLPEGTDVFDWKDLSPDDEAALQRGQTERHWVPDDLFPLNQKGGLDLQTSVGLRHKGEIVGWVLTHRWNHTTLYFRCSYVREDLQRMGYVLPMYAAVVARMRQLGVPNGVWVVPLQHKAMLAFATKRMAPYAEGYEESLGTSKLLELW